MIVVVGSPFHRPGSVDEPSAAVGLAAGIAAAAAAEGRSVQLVGRVGVDPAGDATLLALARTGVGHVAALRDAGRPTPVIPTPSEGESGPLEEPAGRPGSVEAGGPGSLGPATLDRADLELALRYLDGFSVLVVAETVDPGTLAVAIDAAAYAGASLVMLVREGGEPPSTGEAIVLAAPEDDPDGIFARTVGRFAAELDAGAEPAAALAAAVAADGWQPASSEG